MTLPITRLRCVAVVCRFVIPCGMVVCNDSMAYVSGFFFGKTVGPCGVCACVRLFCGGWIACLSEALDGVLLLVLSCPSPAAYQAVAEEDLGRLHWRLHPHHRLVVLGTARVKRALLLMKMQAYRCAVSSLPEQR